MPPLPHELVSNAKNYVHREAGQGTQSVTATALANELHCPVETAVRLLVQLGEVDHLVDIRGVLSCPECHHDIRLAGSTIEAIYHSAKGYSGTPCPQCDADLPDPEDQILRLSFFFRRLQCGQQS